MTIHTRTKTRGLVAAMIALQLGVLASDAAAEKDCDERKGRRGPPAEAFEACADAEEGATCSFVGRRDQTLSGTCEIRRDDFVCVPDGHWSRRNGREDSRS